MIDNCYHEKNDNDIVLFQIIRDIKSNYKVLIIVISVFFIGSIFYSYSTDELFEAKCTIQIAAPTKENSINPANALYGLSLSGLSASPIKNELLNTIKSTDFLEIIIKKYSKNIVIFDNINKNDSPNIVFYKSLETLNSIISINESKVSTDVLEVSVELKDRALAYELLNTILNELKKYIKSHKNRILDDDVSFYKSIDNQNIDPILKRKIQEMVAEKIEKSAMLTSNVFYIIDSPRLPIKKSWPKRGLIIVVSTFTGILFSIVSMLIIKLVKNIHKTIKNEI